MHTYNSFRNNFKSRAFTLLELIVVIVIVTILASLALAQYKKVVEKGRASEAYTNLSKLRKLALAYYYQHRNWPLVDADDNDLLVDIPHDVEISVGGAGCGSVNCSSQGNFYFTYVCKLDGKCSACRCTEGGKSPSVPAANSYNYAIDLETGEVTPSSNAP